MRPVTTLSCLLCMAALTVGCDDDLPKPTLIDSTRMLGARIEVEGDATRSAPRPGEVALVTYPLVGPSPGVDPDRIRSLLIRCTFPNRYTGIPICQEILDVLEGGDPGLLGSILGAGTDPSDLRYECESDEAIGYGGVGIACLEGLPALSVPIEEDFTDGAKLIRGVVCDGGIPYFDPTDPSLFGCKGGDKQIRMFDSIQVSHDAGDDNLNPAPDAMSLRINDRPWRRVELDMERLDPDRCAEWAADEGIPELDPFAHEIRFSVERSTMEELDDGCESLDIEAFATAGEMGRRYTIFDQADCDPDDEDPLRDTVKWVGKGIERPNLDGTLVDFYFTLRDRRGGFVLTKRSACIFTLEPAG